MNYDEVVFLEVEHVEQIHRLMLEQYGGADGVRDRGVLESGVMRVRATFGGAPLYPTLASMAVAYMCGIAMNHAFVDGNKRTALVAALAFLEINGFAISVGPEWVEHVTRVTTGELPIAEAHRMLVAIMGDDPPIETSDPEAE